MGYPIVEKKHVHVYFYGSVFMGFWKCNGSGVVLRLLRSVMLNARAIIQYPPKRGWKIPMF